MTARLDVAAVEDCTANEQTFWQPGTIPLAAAQTACPPAWSRRMLLLERTMYREGLTPFASLFTVRLRGEMDELRLRQALVRIQAKHLLIRCVVENGSDGPRFVARDEYAPVPLRIAERMDDFDWEREVRREWVTPFQADQDPLIRLIWLRSNGVHELILVAHHCICDGQSGMTILRDIFTAYDDPHWDSNAYDSIGTIEDLLPEAVLRTRRFKLRVRWRTIWFKMALAAKALQGLKSRRKISADEMYFLRWRLEPADAKILLERCRRENVTVFAAVGVAVLQAFHEVRGAGALKHAYTMVNARTFIPRLHRDALFGIAPGVAIPIPQQSPSDHRSIAEFWMNTRTIRKTLAERIGRMGERIYEYLAALENLHGHYPRLIAGTDSAPAIRHVTFSNLGRLDIPRHFRDFEVEQIFSPLVMVSPSPANTLVISSFGGAMEFAIVSDEQSLSMPDAAAIRDVAMAILGTCAGFVPRNACDREQQSSMKEPDPR